MKTRTKIITVAVFVLSSCVDLSYSGGDPHEQTSVFRYQ
jgi:hypothetical protein